MYRTHKLNELRLKDCGSTVTLAGWVNTIRNLGAFAFIDLRDRYGITQILIKEDLIEKVKNIKNEFVLQITGLVQERTSKNPKLATGDIEVLATNINILSEAKALPFEINDTETSNENLRLKYRYLDLRKPRMLNNLIKRNTMLFSIREFLNNNGFLDLDTPVLAKATPEGARDFIVPSRIQKGSFYALPQSPQLFKQTLMIAGLDKYYQLAKCFRDEDLRADRQPEFTQVDIEMSFVEQEDIMNIIEKLAKKVFHDVTGLEANYDFPKMSYDDAMEFYGCDKPDTRFDMKLIDIKDCVKNKGFSIFDEAEYIKAIVCDKIFSRKNIKDYEDYVKTYFKAKGLAFIKKENDELNSSILKFFDEDTIKNLEKKLNLKNNQTALIISGKKEIVLSSLSALRLKIAEELNLIDKNKFNFLWIVDFPMFEFSEEENRYKACHHPFTMLKKADIDLLEKNDLANIKSDTYDLVLNGFEIGGGGIRIHDSKLQSLVFDRLLISKEQQIDKFGFLLEALKYGVPPHGGIAFGLDRWLMVMLKENSIKEVIPFPKTNKGQDLLTGAPADVDLTQLEKDLQLKKL
ncbi:aspartate--tRNA ligase [Sneathia sanguinegens]|uniref:aspartate--tRNA ligase n=1 Tax=Sneathia sanguinegens TaxID=40543 RepID=UPI0008297E61|nr:aspartate--tRNA ligase [Sneathia sanguinegens]MDU4652302.1 aspartate--tRNA ligase [Sneathia sanguinegens]MDU7496425.1 aspartate--tRNA ligase [Sneathia sanguinegens]